MLVGLLEVASHERENGERHLKQAHDGTLTRVNTRPSGLPEVSGQISDADPASVRAAATVPAGCCRLHGLCVYYLQQQHHHA